MDFKSRDGLIFDLDGTLWDASEATAEGWNRVVKASGLNGIKVTSDMIRGVAGLPYASCVEKVFDGFAEGKDPTFVAELNNEESKSVFECGGKMFSGVEEGLKKLSEEYRLYLISNCQEWYLKCFWHHSGLKGLFSDWDCHGMSEVPKSEMIRRMVRKHDMKAPVYIGDTPGDSRASSEAEVPFAYAAWGYGDVNDYDFLFQTFNDILE